MRTLNNVNDSLLDLHKQLQIDLLKQLLKLKNLSMDWFDVIMPVVWKCVDLVKPDVKHDNDMMDIRNYIKIKKLACSNNEDTKECRIINGLVFTKNVAHKEMRKNLNNPKILLLRSSIEYQRSEEKMCSLEPILTAESQYLKNYCSKLLIRQNPEILIVEKSVARIAQEIFLQSNVSLILNVKAKIMEKLCRFLQADPMFSIDDLV
jgi:1-phosphatidylinositol-3-phosphate 5-kinase